MLDLHGFMTFHYYQLFNYETIKAINACQNVAWDLVILLAKPNIFKDHNLF